MTKSYPLPDAAAAERLLAELAERPSRVSPCPVDRPLVLYGAGKLGRLAFNLLKRLDIRIAYAVDRMPPASGLLEGCVPVLKPEEVPLADRESHLIALCVVFAPYTPIEESLSGMGWRHIRPFYDVAEAYSDRLPMGNGWFCGALEPFEVEEMRRVLCKLEDDQSRAALLSVLAWRLHREEWDFPGAPIRIDNRFFIDEVRSCLVPEEYLVDCGAYHGTVSRDFVKLSDGACKGIVAIEADRENAHALRQAFAETGFAEGCRLEVIEGALAGVPGECTFHQGFDLASRLDARGTEQVRVYTLDELDLPATFVKLHIEGGELEALQGGLQWLIRRRPLLTVTMYHNRDGLWKIAKFLMENLPDYRFLLRLHAWCATGFVCYAIPNERGNR